MRCAAHCGAHTAATHPLRCAAHDHWVCRRGALRCRRRRRRWREHCGSVKGSLQARNVEGAPLALPRPNWRARARVRPEARCLAQFQRERSAATGRATTRSSATRKRNPRDLWCVHPPTRSWSHRRSVRSLHFRRRALCCRLRDVCARRALTLRAGSMFVALAPPLGRCSTRSAYGRHVHIFCAGWRRAHLLVCRVDTLFATATRHLLRSPGGAAAALRCTPLKLSAPDIQ